MPILISYTMATGAAERIAHSEREADQLLNELRAAGAYDVLVKGKATKTVVTRQPKLPGPSHGLQPADRRIDPSSHSISLADARRPDCPLIYVNNGFEHLTGYRREECLGKNCRFLQGPATDQQALLKMRGAMTAGEPLLLDVLNYRKDGSRFWNRLSLKPVHSEAGELTHIIGIQSDITKLLTLQDTLESWVADLASAPILVG